MNQHEKAVVVHRQDLILLLALHRRLATMKGMAKYLQNAPPRAFWDLQTIGVSRGFEAELERIRLLLEEAEGLDSDVKSRLDWASQMVENHWLKADFEGEGDIIAKVAFDEATMLLLTRERVRHSSSDWSDQELGLTPDFLEATARWVFESWGLNRNGIGDLGTRLETLAADADPAWARVMAEKEDAGDDDCPGEFFSDAAMFFGLLDAFKELVPEGLKAIQSEDECLVGWGYLWGAGLDLIEKIEFHADIWASDGPLEDGQSLVTHYLLGETEVPVPESMVSRLLKACANAERK